MFALVALLSAALAASPSPAATPRLPAKPPADGRVITPQGIQLRLPPGFSYSVQEDDGRRVWIAAAPDGTAVVTVQTFAMESELPCQAEAEGVEVEAFRTARGLEACRVRGEEGGAALALVFVQVKDDVFVAVNAIGPSGSVLALSRSVVDSIEVPKRLERASLFRIERPRPEPRLVGCFEHDRSKLGAVLLRRRCFREDFTFSETSTAAYQGLRKDKEWNGAWQVQEGALLLAFEDDTETEASIQFAGDDIVVDGDLWKRL